LRKDFLFFFSKKNREESGLCLYPHGPFGYEPPPPLSRVLLIIGLNLFIFNSIKKSAHVFYANIWILYGPLKKNGFYIWKKCQTKEQMVG